jgi:hypothetical protein
MTGTERFWDDLVAQGLLDHDEVDEANRLLRKHGGAPDTAILEVRPLGTAEQVRLLRILSRAFDAPIAPPEFLERPEPEALQFFPRELAARHGLLAVHVHPHRLVVVAPALGPHVHSELAFVLGRPIEPYLALELDVRRALRRHLDLPLNDRLTALDGRYAGVPSGATPAPGGPRVRAIRIEPPADALTSNGRFRALGGADVPDGRMRSPLDPPSTSPRPAATAPAPPATDAELQADVRALADGDARADAEARLLAAGERGLDALLAVFPGPLEVDRYTAEPGRVDEHGPVLRALRRFGAAARGPVARLCDSLSPEVRFYAVSLLGALDGPLPPALADRLFDKDPSVRAAAARALAPRLEGPLRAVVVPRLRDALADESAARRRFAAEAAGRLRLDEIVPALIEALRRPAGGTADAVHRALVELTRHDFGPDARPWAAWYDQNRHRPRIEWLLDGLASERRGSRAAAFDELKRLTCLELGFSVDSSPAERRAAIERWRRWWTDDGRTRFAASSGDPSLS